MIQHDLVGGGGEEESYSARLYCKYNICKLIVIQNTPCKIHKYALSSEPSLGCFSGGGM